MVALRSSYMLAVRHVRQSTFVNAAVQTASAPCDIRQSHSSLSFDKSGQVCLSIIKSRFWPLSASREGQLSADSWDRLGQSAHSVRTYCSIWCARSLT